jgi:hypothetical protein
MFRTGGSAGQGITSGLNRQGYKGTDDPADQRVERPRDTSGADFWLNWGANILAQPGGRPILQTLGTAAKEPLARYQAARSAKAKQDFLEQQYEDKMAFEKEKFAEDKRQFGLELEQDWKIAELEAQGEKQFIADQIDEYWDPLIEAETDVLKKEELENQKKADKYNVIVLGEDISDKYKILTNEEAYTLAVNNAEAEIVTLINPETGLAWVQDEAGYNEKLQGLINKYLRLATKFLDPDKKAEGGRAGFLGGGSTEDINVMTETPGGISDINIAERDSGTTNEINISYGQLRDRLPPEISNEIVLLLSKSYEAFADFAEIQTQADVNEFNTKYNVQLFLPQQTGA